jgi:hypothetical protein
MLSKKRSVFSQIEDFLAAPKLLKPDQIEDCNATPKAPKLDQTEDRKCQECSKVFTNRRSLSRHITGVHTKRRSLEVSRSNISPILSQTNKPTPDQPSPSSASHPGSANLYKPTTFQLPPVNDLNSAPNSDQKNQGWKCQECFKGFDSQLNLRRHFTVVHIKRRSSDVVGSKNDISSQTGSTKNQVSPITSNTNASTCIIRKSNSPMTNSVENPRFQMPNKNQRRKSFETVQLTSNNNYKYQSKNVMEELDQIHNESRSEKTKENIKMKESISSKAVITDLLRKYPNISVQPVFDQSKTLGEMVKKNGVNLHILEKLQKNPQISIYNANTKVQFKPEVKNLPKQFSGDINKKEDENSSIKADFLNPSSNLSNLSNDKISSRKVKRAKKIGSKTKTEKPNVGLPLPGKQVESVGSSNEEEIEIIDLADDDVTGLGEDGEMKIESSNTAKTSNDTFKCSKCFTFFPKLSQLICHVKRIHLQSN